MNTGKKEVKVGDKYGKLTVTEIYKEDERTRYKCICDCGQEVKISAAYKLYRGYIKSCGCAVGEKCSERNKSNRIYDSKDYRLLDIWRHMHRRCENPIDISYKYYGNKGIQVCNEWNDFNTFAEWAYRNEYTDDLTIDRIDSNKNYCPENCRWTDCTTQNRNSSHCHYLTYNGVTLSMSAWAERTGLPYSMIKSRLNKLHWTVEEALTVPRNTKHNKIHLLHKG